MRSLICLLIGGFALAAQTVWSQDATEVDVAASLARGAQQSVVEIQQWRTEPQQRKTVLTGFFVNSERPEINWILTYLPAYDAKDTFQIAIGRTMVDARLVALDPMVGLALLQVNNVPRPGLAVADHSPAADQAGTEIYLVNTTSAHGAPAQMGRFAGWEAPRPLDARLLRLNLKVANGSAGSPVFDAQQKLVGLLTTPVPATLDSYYALPAERLQRFLTDVRQHGKPLSSWLGIVVIESNHTARILGCRDNSPAQRAGVEPDDLVLSVGPTKVNSRQELIDTTELLPVDAPVELRVLRGQQIKTLKIIPSVRVKP